jgi:hypothetical protein
MRRTKNAEARAVRPQETPTSIGPLSSKGKSGFRPGADIVDVVQHREAESKACFQVRQLAQSHPSTFNTRASGIGT